MVKKQSPPKQLIDNNDFENDNELDNDNNSDWENGDVGEFEVVKLTDEGDEWQGHIISDCKGDKLPDFVPDGFDDNCYETLNPEGKKGIIPRYYRLVQYVEKYGMGKKIMYRIVRGKKSGPNQSDFVNFTIQFRKLK